VDSKTVLSIVGPLISVAGFIPYLRDTMKGTVKPRIASWSNWTLITGIATVAAITEGAWASAALTGATTLLELLVLVFAFKKSDKSYNKVDGASQIFSLVGVAAWLLTDSAVFAIVFTLFADFFGAVPTLYHAWRKPNEEMATPFLISSFGDVLVIFAVKDYNFVNTAFPAYMTVMGIAIGTVVILRRKQLTSKDINEK
jgi:hypothetical protein